MYNLFRNKDYVTKVRLIRLILLLSRCYGNSYVTMTSPQKHKQQQHQQQYDALQLGPERPTAVTNLELLL